MGRLAQSLLFDLKGYDPAVFIAASVALGLVAFGAGFIPALRASGIGIPAADAAAGDWRGIMRWNL